MGTLARGAGAIRTEVVARPFHGGPVTRWSAANPGAKAERLSSTYHPGLHTRS